jgi:hypothetical protein
MGRVGDDREQLVVERDGVVELGPIVTEAIGTFSERFPNVSLEILEDTSVELLRLLDR